MPKRASVLQVLAVSVIAVTGGCVNTVYKPYEAKNNEFEGKGGTKTVVDGMEIWDDGTPPRKFTVLGIVEDDRPGAVIPMAYLQKDIVKKAREAGGDAVVQLSGESRITGYYDSGNATTSLSGSTAHTSYSGTSVPVTRHSAKFAIIKYLDK